ncbi:hypothetical protein ACUM6W_16970 [Acinetobacter tandoii]|uniref:hypothetical protein n=1 Tax=Acinetobacter tandoii TaxID=202954 RepID=UPI004045CAF8
MSHVTIPVKWLNELLDLCGPEDHELRERVMKSAAPAAPAVDAETIEDAERFRAMGRAVLGESGALGRYPELGDDATIDDVRAVFDAAIAAQAAAKGEHAS